MRLVKTLAAIVLLILFFSAIPLMAEEARDVKTRATISWSGVMNITSDFDVGENDVLIVEPGTEIVFNKPYDWKVNIYGRVEAKGTPDNRIIFRGEYPILNAWKGFHLYTSGNEFSWCNFSNSYYSVRSYTGGQVIEYTNCSTGANGLWLEGDGNIIRGCGVQGMSFLGVSLWGNNNTVSSCIIRDCWDGSVFMKECVGNVIKDCLINPYPSPHQRNGIRMLEVRDSQITNCTFYNCYYALNMEGDCDDNLVSDCNITTCNSGIVLQVSVISRKQGDELFGQRTRLTYNTVQDCLWGITVMGEDHILVGNQVQGCGNWGLRFEQMNTSNNIVSLNNFLNNSQDVVDASTAGNVYHNSRNEGNYYSGNDLNGDKDKDGIADQPYGYDKFPLVEPLEFIDGRLEDFDTDGDGLKDYRDPDDDDDGYSDKWELKNGHDPKDPDDPEPDSPLFTIGLVVFILCLLGFLGWLVYMIKRHKNDDKDDN